MLLPRKGLPAHLALLLNEPIPFDDWAKARKKLRGMLRDVRDQAEVACRESTLLESRNSDRFVVAMNGGLDLFRREGACTDLLCRISYAEQIARSIALMADEVIMHDFVVDMIIDMDARSNRAVDALLQEIFILKTLAPLIEFELISFDPPVVPVCTHCLAEIEKTTDQIIDQIYSEFRPQMRVGKYYSGQRFIDTGPLYNPSLHLRLHPSSEDEDDVVIRRAIAHCIAPAMFDLAAAARHQGTVFSNSPVAMSAMLAAEGRFEGEKGLRALDAQRAGALPWVKGLSIEQTLELRQEARKALPQLREFLATNLSGNDSATSGRGTTEEDYIARLREQAEEVRSELAIVTAKSPRLTQTSLGIATLGVSALGILNDGLNLPSVGLGLIGIIGAIRGLAGPHEEHERRQKSRPGYVLVAAQDILQHAGAK